MSAVRLPRVRARRRRGRCYELAAKGQEKATEWVLVHGAIASRLVVAGIIGHAWLEHDGHVYDGVDDQLYARDDYYARFHARPIACYAPAEAARLMLEHGHFGPWCDEVPE